MSESKIVIELTDEQAKGIVEEARVLRGATSVAPGQTPMLDRLLNTLILMLHPGRAA